MSYEADLAAIGRKLDVDRNRLGLHQQAIMQNSADIRSLENQAPPPVPVPPDPGLEWAMGFGAAAGAIENRETVLIPPGDFPSLRDAARAPFMDVHVAGGDVLHAPDPFRGALLVLGEGTRVVCDSHDARLQNIGLGTPLGWGTVVEGFHIALPDMRQSLSDLVQFHSSNAATDWVVAYCSFGLAPDETFSIWANKKGVSGGGTIFRCRIDEKRLHPASTQNRTHGVLVGLQSADRPNMSIPQTQVTIMESVLGTGSRQPTVSDGALVHEIRSIHEFWSYAAVEVKRGGRYRSDGSYWTNGGALRSRDSAIIAPDGNATIDVRDHRFDARVSGVISLGDPISIPYDFPMGGMSDAAAESIRALAGAR